MQYQFLHHDRCIDIYIYILVYRLWIYVIFGIGMGDSGWNKCGWKEGDEYNNNKIFGRRITIYNYDSCRKRCLCYIYE